MKKPAALFCTLAAIALALVAGQNLTLFAAADTFHFVLLGDHTGEAQPGVYERVWKDVASAKPAFVLSVGDTIQGLNDQSAASEWTEVDRLIAPFRTLPIYLTPGNHDVWSDPSAALYTKHSGHPLHYSFDWEQAHFTVLDNSRTEELPASELQFLTEDLKAHEKQPLKFILSHRPSWLIKVIIGDSNFELQRIAKQYGVRFILAGHVHELLTADLDGVRYYSAPSAGGHLRATGKYEDGWFFGWTDVEVNGTNASFTVHELGPLFGQGRTTNLNAWGKAGLLKP